MPEQEQERFSLKAVIAETEREPFSFDGPGGEDLTLPHMSVLTLGQAYDLEAGKVREVLTEIAPDVEPVLMKVPGFALDALIAAWMKHAGTNPGELLASSKPSKTTGRRSTPTSRRTTTSTSRRSARPS